MIHNYVPPEWRKTKDYEIAFDDGRGNGFAFPCDKEGKLLDDVTPQAASNYHRCLQHPEMFTRFNKVIETERSYKENAHGTCDCGESVELYNQYMGTCQCPRCGQWYNLFGQKLLPPEEWDD